MKKSHSEVLKLTQVTKVYNAEGKATVALSSTTLSVNQADYIAIKGPSGSGKSTLLHLMGLLDLPTSGDIYLNGQLVSKMSEPELARLRNQHIGFVFQQFNLLPRLAAWEQVALPLVYAGISLKKRYQRSIETLGRVGLEGRIKHNPNELSGGQQQRVAIARALVNNPSIIFADEPTGNLDSASGKLVMQIFDKLNRQGATIILVTHEDIVAGHADKVLYIKDGVIGRREHG